jgi:Putative peptidoglycan binding domain
VTSVGRLLTGVGRLLQAPWRRVLVAVLAAAGVALIIGIASHPGSSRGAGASGTQAQGVATVQRRDLVATDTESGTLGYANPQTVFSRLSGTITWLPQVGDVVQPGGTLLKVNGQPVVLMSGSQPAYRDLAEGVSDGQDVNQLERNLVAMGFDPGHLIKVDDTFDAATTAAVEHWQASLGETQTGQVTLGDVVFLPGAQRITAVNAVLGSAGGTGSGAGSSGAGTITGASTRVTPAQPEFVSLVTTTTTSSTGTRTSPTTTTTSTTTTTTAVAKPKPKPNPKPAAQRGGSSGRSGSSGASTLSALLALLKAETAELKSGHGGAGASSGSSSVGRSGGAGESSGGRAAGGGGTAGAGGAAGGGGSAAAGGGGASGSASGSGSAGASAQAILQTTSTQLVVTVDLDATKQTEAVIGEPVTVELPDGSTVDGKISAVSPVAQTSSGASSSGGGSSSGAGGGSGSGGSGAGGGSAGGGGGSGSPSATIPVTITLMGHRHPQGLDQAAVSVNFEQQKATNVLSVPVTALVATAGGGYAVQPAGSPQRLIAVTPGLFAAGYVQISGTGLYPGLRVTDSQG